MIQVESITNADRRMILYYPVSALVTLFANILQNSQDARARSDLKLMSSVVSFLTMLERDVAEANSNVRRMLSVCAEFERIARVALDKVEREMRGRGKRKLIEREREKALKERGSGEVAAGLEEGKTLEQMQIETQAAYRRPVQTPSLLAGQGGGSPDASPASWAGIGSPAGVNNGQDYRTPGSHAKHRHSRSVSNGASHHAGSHTATSPYMNQYSNGIPGSGLPQDYSNHQQQQQYMSNDGYPPNSFSPTSVSSDHMGDFGMNFAPQQNPPGDLNNIVTDGAFQQPFVPQDLWQMPMTLEWDWAEGLGMGSFATIPMYGPGGSSAAGGGGGRGDRDRPEGTY